VLCLQQGHLTAAATAAGSAAIPLQSESRHRQGFLAAQDWLAPRRSQQDRFQSTRQRELRRQETQVFHGDT